jgi:hypothetical protein
MMTRSKLLELSGPQQLTPRCLFDTYSLTSTYIVMNSLEYYDLHSTFNSQSTASGKGEHTFVPTAKRLSLPSNYTYHSSLPEFLFYVVFCFHVTFCFKVILRFKPPLPLPPHPHQNPHRPVLQPQLHQPPRRLIFPSQLH